MKKIMMLVVFFLIILVLPLVNAENKTVFYPGEEVNLYIDCKSHGNSPCPDTTKCNITSYYPNGTVKTNDSIMSHNADGSFNYSFGTLGLTGEYTCNIFCEDTSLNEITSATITFEISDDYTLGLIILLVILAFVFVFLSFNLEEHSFLQILFFFTCLILLIVICGLLDNITTESYSNILNVEYRILIYTFILSFAYFIFYFIYNAIKNVKQKQDEELGGGL